MLRDILEDMGAIVVMTLVCCVIITWGAIAFDVARPAPYSIARSAR